MVDDSEKAQKALELQSDGAWLLVESAEKLQEASKLCLDDAFVLVGSSVKLETASEITNDSAVVLVDSGLKSDKASESESGSMFGLVGSSTKSQQASLVQSDSTFLLVLGIWLACGVLGFSVLMACILPSGIEGTCSSRLLVFLLYLFTLALVSAVVAICGAHAATLVFESFFACIRHRFFAQIVQWGMLQEEIRVKLSQDPRYIELKGRRRRRAFTFLMMLAILAGAAMVYTHFHYLSFLRLSVLRRWQYFSEPDDPYGVLGLDRHASLAQVKKAYRQISLKCHPEKVDHASVQQHECFFLMPRAHAAWTILSNSTLKIAWENSPLASFDAFLLT